MISVNKLKKKQNISLIAFYLLLLTFSQVNGYNSSTQVILLSDYTDISVSDAYHMTQNTTNLFILDVRTTEEYSAGHIKDSYLLLYTEIESRQDELPENKSQPILVYCRSGRRSANASETLIGLNYTTIFNMLDGFSAWLEANYLYEKSSAGPTLDLTDLILVIIIFSSLGLVLIISIGLIASKKKILKQD